MKFYQFLLMSLCSLSLLNCSDGDETKTNQLVVDGTRYKGLVAYYDYIDFEEDFFDLDFVSDEGSKDEAYIRIQLDKAWNGKKLDLTKIDNQYDNNFYFELYINDEFIMEHNGHHQESVDNVKKGSVLIKIIDAEKGIIEIYLNVEFEGRNLKLYYKGDFIPYD